MTIDEAIYCMQSYLPETDCDLCANCKWYGYKKMNKNLYVCASSEAHRMAIQALKDVKEKPANKNQGSELINALNSLIEASLNHGGDPGGAYFCFPEEQKAAVEKVANLLDLDIDPVGDKSYGNSSYKIFSNKPLYYQLKVRLKEEGQVK